MNQDVFNIIKANQDRKEFTVEPCYAAHRLVESEKEIARLKAENEQLKSILNDNKKWMKWCDIKVLEEYEGLKESLKYATRLSEDFNKELESLRKENEELRKDKTCHCPDCCCFINKKLQEDIESLRSRCEGMEKALNNSIPWLKSVEEAGIRYVCLGAQAQRLEIEAALAHGREKK
jgi:chromosome segregation ATPase